MQIRCEFKVGFLGFAFVSLLAILTGIDSDSKLWEKEYSPS